MFLQKARLAKLFLLFGAVCVLISLTVALKDTSSQPYVRELHFTVKDKKNISASQKEIVMEWKRLNSGYKINIYDDKDMFDLFKFDYPEFLTLANNLPAFVEVTDLWRYLIVHKHGGMYADTDLFPKLPLDEWLTEAEKFENLAIISAESLKQDSTVNHFLQWGFFATNPKHNLFYTVARVILEQYMDELESGYIVGDAVQRTGPVPFTIAVWKHLKLSRSFVKLNYTEIKLIEDVKILGVDYVNKHYAEHNFDGSWKHGTWTDRVALAKKKVLKLGQMWKEGNLIF